MLIKYYNNPELAYANRKRYKSFSFSPFYTERQRSVLLGDGATTQVKTSKDNICNYVMIDDTRWFVTSYTYMNGGQVKLNLQRDVIGEFGIDNCFGQIERGYTETFLRNRKELKLNQILKKRIPIIPQSNIYGNYNVNNHNNEIWGILYLTKPADGQITIPIPAFTPNTVDYEKIENGTQKISAITPDATLSFLVKFDGYNISYWVDIYFDYINNGWVVDRVEVSEHYESVGFVFNISTVGDANKIKLLQNIGIMLGNAVINKDTMGSINLPNPVPVDDITEDYNGVVVKDGNDYLSYTVIESQGYIDGQTPYYEEQCVNTLNGVFEGKYISDGNQMFICSSVFADNGNGVPLSIDGPLRFIKTILTYNYRILSASEKGDFTIDISKQNLVDEPYYILVCPLYDVNITGNGTYNIDKKTAFEIFNSVVQTLSGENGYLVDAQIYPYCPVLTGVTAEIKGFPFFNINSTSYERSCLVQLLPSSDIKKEYIQREYSIVSPEQSSKFTFNFYDYVNKIENVNGLNYTTIQIIIKTALKPFAIISSAVIQPEAGSLMNLTYGSDLRGSQPSSNGFECSLASNAFETYKRQNSNYQQIFNLEKDELKAQHWVEGVNDATSAVVNTATATAMGAMAGGSLGDTGLGNMFGTKTAGAASGAAIAGGTVGAAMAFQTAVNATLMAYEEDLQQQRFDLNIGTIKNLPNTINRVSSFNEIILRDFWFIIEVYECSNLEKNIVDNFIANYAYGIGIFDYLTNYLKNGYFLRAHLLRSNYAVNLHNIANKELKGGIYYYYE